MVLREGMVTGRWRDTLPGRYRLAKELGVNHKTVEEAVKRLEAEGLLQNQGDRKKRKIVIRDRPSKTRALRVKILSYDRDDSALGFNSALMDRLNRMGFAATYSVKSLTDLRMDVLRVARWVKKTEADAWIVYSASREVLEWFSQQSVPALALFGRFTGLPIACASPRVVPSMQKSVRRLHELGHRRIVLLAGESRRKPYPALFEQKFLEQLDSLGLSTGTYNLPDWENHADGLRGCLNSLFRVTPPTALICGETRIFMAAYQHLSRRGIHAPEHVSLICSDPDPAFQWLSPSVAHYSWSQDAVMGRVARWLKNVAAGKEDRRQELFEGEFVEGGTIGPAPVR